MEAKFKYRAVNESGVIVQGIIESQTEIEAVNSLRNKGIRTIKIEREEAKSKDINVLTSSKLSLKELVMFCRQTSTMLNAGMSLNRCLDIMIVQSSSKKVKGIMKDLATSIQKGEAFSYAMELQSENFPMLLRRTVEAGEMTGQLGEVLEKMAIHYEKEQKIRGKIKGAMMYPIVLGVVAAVSTTILLVGVMPNFLSIFESTGVEFPKLTQVVIYLSKLLTNYWYILILVIIGLIFLIKRLLKQPNIRLAFDKHKLNMILIGSSIRKIITARFTRTLATMLSSGISVIPAIISAGQNTQNAYVEKQLQTVVTGIEKGMGMTSQLEKIRVFPPMMLSMIGIGEESGNLSAMLDKTADYYDEELEVALHQIVSLIEPLMIVLMAVIIGTIVVAMYLPMFEAFKTLQ